MLVISNNARKIGVPIPKEAIIRINVAWVKSYEELCSIVEENKENKVWIDYPTGRTKPPKPVLTLAQAISVASKYNNVEFFAFSNAENCDIIELIRQAVPKHITLVPKIETEKGINNIAEILKSAQTSTIMLDAEDLYVDLNHDSEKFESLKIYVKTFCDRHDIKMLSLQTVVFS